MPKIQQKNIWTLCFFISFTVIVLIFFLLFKGQQVIYYSPVFNAQGESVAYVKRLLDYQVQGGSLMPFMGEQAALAVQSDRLQLCQKNLRTRKETVLQDWMIDLDQRNQLGSVWVQIDWHGPSLKYHVRLTGYGQINLGREMIGPTGTEWILSNIPEPEGLQHGPMAVGRAQVSLDANPEKIRFPYANRLIIEKR